MAGRRLTVLLPGVFAALLSGMAAAAAPTTEPSSAFRNSFRLLMIPTGAMTADKDEMLLRTQVCDLAGDIAFLGAVAHLEMTKEQAEKLLPAARQVRDMAAERCQYLIDSWKAYGVQVNNVRANNILVMTGCDRERIQAIVGRLEGMGGPPGYVKRR